MNKLFKNVFYLISIGISVVICIAILFASKGNQPKFVSAGLIIMYVLMALGLLVTLVLALKGMIDKPKSAVMTLVGLGVLGILILVGYLFDDHAVPVSYTKYGVNSPEMSGLIGGSLIATWIIMGLAILLTLYAAVIDFVKKM